MAYATEAQLDTKWGADLVTLVAADAVTGLRALTKIEAALDAASAKMDAVLMKRELLPLDPTPAGEILLRNLCCDLAMGEMATVPGTRNDIVEAAEKKALDFLNLIASGKADIPVNVTGRDADVGPISPNEAVIVVPERRFTRENM